MRDGITSLKSDLWKEVEANWFFYSPEDAAIVQKSILLWMMRSLPVLCLFKRSRRKLTLKKKNKQPPRPFCVDLGRKVKRGICLLEEYTKQWAVIERVVHPSLHSSVAHAMVKDEVGSRFLSALFPFPVLGKIIRLQRAADGLVVCFHPYPISNMGKKSAV
ncbi:hypothetical protein HNY73_006022 [Argiope bruennichi]|uniref:Uncharacterized protein n=1 Tax=Argiope bruennichi TaxID=94029 RepID=A0A8T0FL39_ARGBR|nr:hypothetical protein HNY73_006022 [Argiope bruennichi]